MEVLSRSKKRSTATNPYRHRELYPLSHPHDTAPPGSPQGIASPLLVVGVPLSPPLRTCASLERLQSNNTSFDRSTVKVSKYLLYSPRRSSVQANQRARVGFPPSTSSSRLQSPPATVPASRDNHTTTVETGRPRRGFEL
jgi:hypothetical protein